MYAGLEEKLKVICDTLTANWDSYHRKEYPNSYAVSGGPRARLKWGGKYVKLDRQGPGPSCSALFMVDIESGTIYGTKGYGVVNKRHSYGTVDTFVEKYAGNTYFVHGHG